MSVARKQVRRVPNPTGKGGFQERPQDRSRGMWKKEDSIGYQYNKLIRLRVDQFKKWTEENPEKKRTMAQELAYQAVIKARKELHYLKEVTDRTEGRAIQPTDITSDGERIEGVLIYRPEKNYEEEEEKTE